LDDVLIAGIAIALIGLVQGAGVSKATPNPDRQYPDVSRDFFAQGVANGIVAWFRGMPVGASVSGTGLIITSGAVSRWANVWAGITVLGAILLFAPLVSLIPLSVVAAVLIVASTRSIRVASILEAWYTGMGTRVVMAFTFVATLFMPIQYAVVLGAGLSFIQYIWSASGDVRVVRLLSTADGIVESDPPAQLPSEEVTMLDIYGNLFFAGSEELRNLLPDPQGARCPVVVLRMRGRTNVGSTEIQLLRRYLDDIEAEGGTLFMADQFSRTGFEDIVTSGRLFPAEKTVYASVLAAESAARSWLESRCVGGAEGGDDAESAE
jgi:SulP family sulfate permease